MAGEDDVTPFPEDVVGDRRNHRQDTRGDTKDTVHDDLTLYSVWNT